jgi:nucleotide-binding universal stress UspA family protein
MRDNGAVVLSGVAFSDTAGEIVKLAEETKADLSAMSGQAWSGIKSWVFGNVTDKLLRQGGWIPGMVAIATSH